MNQSLPAWSRRNSRRLPNNTLPVTPHPNPYCALPPDHGAAWLTEKIRERGPFFFVRYGDGALECMNGLGLGRTCDREHYSPNLGVALMYAWDQIMQTPCPIVGDWLSASFDAQSQSSHYEAEYRRLIGTHRPEFVHFESLLLNRDSAFLLNFYRTVRDDPRSKVFMGPAECAGAARMLGARHVVTPMINLFAHVGTLADALLSTDFEVLLFGAGMAGNVAVAKVAQRHPERQYVNLGSAMDPLFRGQTRLQQLSTIQARNLFKELL